MLFDKDATHYAKQIKHKETSVIDLVERALKNIEEVNPKLNAVVHVQKQEALMYAQALDKKLTSLRDDEIKQLPTFYGVPILLKDLGQEEAGQASISGAKLSADYVAKTTSNFTKKVLEAGFVIVGRTNVPEFGFKNASDSQLTGAVNSPFDTERNAGGSSGGAASALKAGIVPIVTASDGGGSIRIPASFNGLIGLKPTRGRTPVGPGSYRGWQGASIDFVLTKSVRDTWNMLQAMQVEQYDAPFLVPFIRNQNLKPLNTKLKFAYTFDSPIGHAVSEDAKTAVEIAVKKLKELGHTVVENKPETDGIKAMRTYYIVNGVETASMIEDIENGMERDVNVNDLEPMSWALYRSGLKISGVEYSQVLVFWDQLSAAMEDFFEEYDALISPTTNGPAFKHHQFDQDDSFIEKLENIDQFEHDEQQKLIWEMFHVSLNYTPFTQQQNLTGQPAISLPLYETDAGLPIGTQIWTRKGAEVLLLQIAKEFEDARMLKTDVVEINKSF